MPQEISTWLQRRGRAGGCPHFEGDGAEPSGSQRQFLKPAPALAAWLDPHALELAGNVGRGDAVAGFSRAASLQQVVGQETDVGGDSLRTDAAGGGVRSPGNDLGASGR